MDEYRNQNSDEQNGSDRPHPSESPYSSGSPMGNQPGQAPNQPPYGQQPWQNASQNDQQYWQNGPQNNQQYWQSNSPNGQQPWQNGPQNNQSYWQNDSQNNQPYWQNNSPNNQPYWQNGQPPKRRNNLALASMIVGIFALITCCVPFIQFPLAVTAIVLVILSKKKQPLSGFAIAGLVMGILAILLSIVMLLYWGAYLQLMNDPEFSKILNEIMEMYQ